MDEWQDEIQGCIVRDVKKILSSRPLLKLPDPRRKYYLNVGACIRKVRGLGATLSQEYSTPPPNPNFVRRTNKHRAGKGLHVIEYWSRLLTDKEPGPPSVKPSAYMTLSCIGHPS
jgi:hypothetical protein